MSQPPFSYDPTLPYQGHSPPPPPLRPTVVSVLAILGIVFGSLGVLCVGFGAVVQALFFFNKNLGHSLHQPPMSTQVPQLVLALIGFLLSGVLLVGSIGSLMLKPASRRLMVGWAWVDIVFDLVKLVVTLTLVVPQMSQNQQVLQNPSAPQMLPMMRAFGAVFAVVAWIVATAYPVLVLVFFRKPEIVAAFERGPGPAAGFNSPLPPPPFQP